MLPPEFGCSPCQQARRAPSALCLSHRASRGKDSMGLRAYSRGQKKYQYHFDVDLRYMIVRPYLQNMTVIFVNLEAPTAQEAPRRASETLALLSGDLSARAEGRLLVND